MIRLSQSSLRTFLMQGVYQSSWPLLCRLSLHVQVASPCAGLSCAGCLSMCRLPLAYREPIEAAGLSCAGCLFMCWSLMCRLSLHVQVASPRAGLSCAGCLSCAGSLSKQAVMWSVWAQHITASSIASDTLHLLPIRPILLVSSPPPHKYADHCTKTTSSCRRSFFSTEILNFVKSG